MITPRDQTVAIKTEAGKMGKKIVTFGRGESETDDVVRRWLDRKGISQGDVSGYSIFRHRGEVPRIMLEMYFDDAPATIENPVVTVPVSPELLTELGEQWSAPVQVKIERQASGTYEMMARRLADVTGLDKAEPEYVPRETEDPRDQAPGY